MTVGCTRTLRWWSKNCPDSVFSDNFVRHKTICMYRTYGKKNSCKKLALFFSLDTKNYQILIAKSQLKIFVVAVFEKRRSQIASSLFIL